MTTSTMSKKKTRSAAFVLSLFVGGATVVAACGGAPPPKLPSVQAGQSATAGEVATNGSGQQVGVSDVSSSGEPDNFPKLSSAARGPYDRGMAFWQAGDLLGAKGAFTESTSADSNAFQAFYSLGVVEERLTDPGALSAYRQASTLQPTY